jgi:sulfur carrier protein
MKVVVRLMNKKRSLKVPERSKVSDIVKKAKVNPETVIVRRGEDILLEEDLVKKHDEIEFIRIISGG